MAINFPDSPSNGDTYTAAGKTFTYNSTRDSWSVAAAGASGVTTYATIDDLPLSGQSNGAQAFVTGTNRLYIWSDSGWYNIALINTTPSISNVNSSYTLSNEGANTFISIVAEDPEGIPITYSIASDTSGDIATVTQGSGNTANEFTITPTTNTDFDGESFSLTFRASDGVNIATALSTFTLTFNLVISNSKYTTALITSVGTNNQVNNTFTDSSTNSHTITATGNATQSTFSPYRQGGYSTYLDGNGDTLTVPSTSTVAFGTGAFTVEAWVYILSTGDRGIFQTGGSHFPTTASASSAIQITNSGTKWGIYANNTSYQSTVTYSLNRWYHVALVRGTNSYTTLYVDGTAVIGNSDAANYSGTYLGIGSIYGGAAAQCFNGYIRDFRVVKGTAVYTSAFTPPTERLTAITNTSLLTCHLPYITDGSTNGHSITVNGDTKTEPFSPYDYETYSATDNSGSIYFDGSSNITVADDASLELGGSDFCIEFWFYPLASVGNEQALFSKGWSFGSYGSILLYTGSGGSNYVMYGSSSGSTWDLGSAVDTGWAKNDFKWQHLCFSRDGNTFRFFKNGEQTATFTNTNSFMDSSAALSILSGATNGNRHAKAIVSDFRYVVGSPVRTADFTPPTAPLTAITNTSLLLNGTNAGIIDKSQSVKTITLNGDVKSSTAQSKYLTSSMYFDGSGDWISLNGQSGSAYGTNDFTIEGWFQLTVNPNTPNYRYFFGQGSNTTGTNNFALYYQGNVLKVWHNNTQAIIGTNALSLNTWHHIALARDGTNLRLFLDGTQEGSTSTNSSNITSTATGITLGRWAEIGDAGYFIGYVSDFRVTKGLARYTTSFTPPTDALGG